MITIVTTVYMLIDISHTSLVGTTDSDLQLTQYAKVFYSSKTSVFYANFTWVPIPLKLHSCQKSENLEGRAQKEIVKVSTDIQSR